MKTYIILPSHLMHICTEHNVLPLGMYYHCTQVKDGEIVVCLRYLCGDISLPVPIPSATLLDQRPLREGEVLTSFDM